MKNKLKGAIILLVIIVVAFTAYGCGKSKSQTDASIVTTVSAQEVAKEVNFGFELIYKERYFEIYREVSTDVLYARCLYSSSGSLESMPDPETGNALTYTKWIENYKNK